ncbi:H-NS histone [Burkholderia ubonensis]|uniref:H-NS histone n=1 Tax=Burkholderia ubonensis TaxID=101571 RepID=A0A107G191_9BURK|nr:H-NS histone family protein [Burkholderia ubonensis]KWD84097.1 H-NS histone [Burkholderia ubonensis]KWD85532.1 H-NS histone [Burkholderia ubonensis]KWE03202.1 H-NS histone [Burkholderia ubonensis]KWE03457.1 H-NS histone [Burkholderia ubonensis]KWK69859.1 H-NS histone [Burkholderia ubonensis]
MATLAKLKAQHAELQQQIEATRLAELQTVIEQVRTTVQDYGLTAEDIFGRQTASRSRTRKAAPPPKYRDPKTGATWSGRGREPSWIKGKRHERFLIESE